ncbi:RNA polymerase sigma factor [Actinomadura luteofluorescens]|uniref:RNA polymerase sigma factor n=1 Tax=Actinomadura luteofluorescens TaxID=46163 RepID=UPI0030D10019
MAVRGGLTETGRAVAAAFREEWGRVVATLIRMTGDWDLAEECAQEAFARALERWPRDGVPRRPGAWLTTTARNHALNRIRRGKTETAKLRELETMADTPERPDQGGLPDDRLRLIYTCCHPALPVEARVALTLRTVLGLTTGEIARAFLVAEPAMAQRLVRAKRKIRQAGVPYRVPPAHLLAERTASVLGVVYLLFNEGYAATEGSDPVRSGLCGEAIRLARLLHDLAPDDPEVTGLLALLLLQHSRHAARTDGAGDLVALEDQDRSRWDRAAIAEGAALVDEALRRGEPGPYQVQAAIAACHGTARTAGETDWPQIAALYGRLEAMSPGPVVRLNRAVAVAMADGALAGLALVDRVEGLEGYHLLHATRADLLRRLGRREEAAAAYREALALSRADADRRYLARRLGEVRRAG